MNSPKKPASFQDIVKLRQRSDFVGRGEEVNIFRRDLSLPPEDQQRHFIFNVWGQGGVGKTYFLHHCRKIAEDAQGVTAYVDEDIKDVPALMAQMVKQFEEKGHKFKDFQERYKTFRQKKEQLEADPEAPEGFGALAGRAVTKGAFKIAEHIPGADIAVDFVGDKTRDALAEQVGSWTSYVARSLKNKDEVKLVLEPETVLTPLFLQDLNKVAAQGCVGLLFDTYEQTDVYVEEWLLDILEGKYGDIPLNIFFLIAGRNQLNPNLWSGYEGLIAHFPLEKFSDRELQDYLARKGINDVQVREVIENLSGNLPLLVAMLAAGTPNSVEALGDPCDTAVERFLKWIEDPQKRKVALNAALLRHLNRDKLAVLVGEEQATSLFAWLKQKPFVLKRTDGWAYHDVVRQQMLNYQRRESEKIWQELHGKLAVYYEQRRDGLGLEGKEARKDEVWQNYALEALYHRLCEKPRKFLAQVLNNFLATFSIQNRKTLYSFSLRWSKTMKEAGHNTECKELVNWGEMFLLGLEAFIENKDGYGIDTNKCLPATKLFTALAENANIKDKSRAVALNWLGFVNSECGQSSCSVENLTKAIQLVPKEANYWAERGVAYQLAGQYKKALNDLNKAIELKPDMKDKSEYDWVIANRGEVYCRMKRYSEAIEDFSCAIKLSPKYAWAISGRGEAYSSIERYKEALIDFNCAIGLKPSYKWTFVARGRTYRSMECYEEALTNFNRAIELDPEYTWAIANRGYTYQLMERYEEALTEFNQAIEIDSEYTWAINQRAEIYRLMGLYKNSLADYNKVMVLDKEATDWNTRGLVLSYLGNYAEAIDSYKNDLGGAIDFCCLYNIAVAKFRWQRSQAQPEFNAAYQTLKAAEKDKPGEAAYGLGGLAALIGKNDLALKYLHKAISLKKEAITWARHDIAWLDLRKDKRFQALIMNTKQNN